MSTSSYSTPSNVDRSTHLTQEQYQKMYERSVRDPKNFWSEAAQKFISWFKPWDEVCSGNFDKHDVIWFKNAKVNAAYNCLDRHLEKRAKQTAIFWEGDDPKDTRTISYAQLHEEVCRFSLVLKKLKIKKGDRVCIYMPMIPETVVAMLACARIGAIHSVVFGGFSADSLRNRILDADCQIVITANESVRGGKNVPLKANVDEALIKCPNVKTVIVIKRTDNEIEWKDERDNWYHDLMKDVSGHCPAEMLDAQDPLFILYTSGSTGQPKGILHTTGGYLVYAAMTHHYVFDYHEGDIYWCTADVGWVTGHTYSVYGPLLNGATIVMFEGVPHYPDFSRFWQIIDKYQVNIFYTAPTAIRALRREGDKWVTQTKRDSLKLLGSVGEPINPDVWQWYFDVVGNRRCNIVDTWWQTETGGILISPLPGATKQKAGSAGVPFFGVVPVIVDDHGKVVDANAMGKLVVTQPWPGMMKTIYKNRERFVETYFKDFPGKYFSGDNARQDEEGYFWITGRNDDVIKVSGHRLGTGEVENALLEESSVSEAAVVEVPNEIKGHSIYAFVTLKAGAKPSADLKKKIINTVRRVIGPIAAPDFIQWTDALPKTRSGKIMRRLLRKIANNELEDLGDVSTLADPQVIDSLITNRIDYTSGK